MHSILSQSLRGLRSILNAYISCQHASTGELLKLSNRYGSVALSSLEATTFEYVGIPLEAVRLLFTCAKQDPKLFPIAFHVSAFFSTLTRIWRQYLTASRWWKAALFLLRRGLLWDQCGGDSSPLSPPSDASRTAAVIAGDVNADTAVSVAHISVTKKSVTENSAPSEVSTI